MQYTPAPLDTSSVVLSESLAALLERLAENTHEVWAVARTADGWTYGPVRDDLNKRHPCLVPYPHLPESEKEYDRTVVRETIKALLQLGWTIHPARPAGGPGSG
jgi:ryanodine receptor 2